ncbi:unnamed protein product [Blepharisma stoltei]|uniref:Uncharacterized protein n=1 Tax=Blepharisma stoltei TaxID=1481888 RepID=A0AAU9KGC4_9CILI|nr:unnamed protein product [Blepharisma stoltei]
MKFQESMDSMADEASDKRNRKANEERDPKKRTNAKETRIRNEKMLKRQKQREEAEAAKETNTDDMEIEEDDLKRVTRRKDQEVKHMKSLSRKAENQNVYINEFIDNIVGKKPENLNTRQGREYREKLARASVPGFKSEKLNKLKEEVGEPGN